MRGGAEDDLASRDDLVVVVEGERLERPHPRELRPAGGDALAQVLPRAQRRDFDVRMMQQTADEFGPAVAARAQNADADGRSCHEPV